MTAIEAAQNGAAPVFDLASITLRGRVSRFEMPWLGHNAYLLVASATADNPEYVAAVLRRSNARMAHGQVGDEQVMDRTEDRDIYPLYVVKGWGGIRTRGMIGDLVPFSVDAAVAWFKAIPDWLMLRIRAFCSDPERLIRSGDAPAPDPVQVAGNS